MKHLFEASHLACVLSHRKNFGTYLTIYESDAVDDGVYSPAKSICIPNRVALESVRDNITKFLAEIDK